MVFTRKASIFNLVVLGWGFLVGCQKAPTKTTYAVLVGIADYKATDYRNGDLRYADEDARRFGAFLQSAAGGKVPAHNIHLLTNRAATKSAILKALRLFKKATPQDRVIFYFSGHGLKGGFLPYDVSPSDPASVLTHQEVKAGFKASSSATKLCIADACLSGSMTARQAWSKPLSATMTSSNVVLMLSSRSTQLSVESGMAQGGIFTFFMLKGLGGSADLNQDKSVTIRELYTYLSPRIRQNTANHQSPLFYGKFSDDLPLSTLR
jgi:uncharacterized caspase-like protein